MEKDKPWMNDDRDGDGNYQSEDPPVEVVLEEELDAEYGREYFRKFEPNPLYDRNEYDASYKSVRAVRKYCLERGLPYLRHNGHQQPARRVKDACVCRKLCYAKFSDDLREKLLNNLLELSAEGQNTFLICHIESISAHRPKQAQQQNSVRNYYLPSDSGRIRVCKLMFANTFDLSPKKLRGFHRKAKSGAYDKWLKELLPVVGQIDSNVSIEEPDTGSDAEDEQMTSDQIPTFNDQSNENQPEAGSDDDLDNEQFPLNSGNENDSAESKPSLDDVFLDRYFHQKYGLDPIETESLGSMKDIPTEPCSCVVFNCTSWFTDDVRQMIYVRYATLPPSKQDQFLQDHTKQVPKKRPKKLLSSRRSCTYLYLIPTSTGQARVCKKMFLNTFKINDHMVRDLNERRQSTEPQQETTEDQTKDVQSNTKRVSSVFAFDPTLTDPLALPGTALTSRKKRRSSKLTDDANSSSEMSKMTKLTTKRKRCSQEEVAESQHVGDDHNKAPTNNSNHQPKVFQYQHEAAAGCSKSANPSPDIGEQNTEDLIPESTLNETHLPQASNDANEEVSDIQMNSEIADDELDIKYSYELLNIEPQDDYNANNDPESSHSASAAGMDQAMNELVPITPEIDDDFLDEYFIQFEINDGRQLIRGRKIKPMTRANASDDHIVMEPCSCVIFQCFTWLTDDLRQKLYSRFVRLAPLSQKLFVKRHVRREEKKRSKLKSSRRNYSMFYFMPTKKGQFKVCKVMFMNTFKVTDKKLRTLLDRDQFEIPEVETTCDDVELDAGIDSSYLHVQCNEEPQNIDQFNTDINEAPESFSNNLHDENPQPDALSDSYQAASVPVPNNCSSDEETISETETHQMSSIVECDDAFLDEYFAPYETATNREVYVARKRWITAYARPSALQPCVCPEQCSNLFPDDLRFKIFTRFSILLPLQQQRFLRAHIKIDEPPKRHRFDLFRKVRIHFLPAKPGPVKVCRQIFMNTFRVSNKLIHIVMKRDCVDSHEEETDRLKLNEATKDDGCRIIAATSDEDAENYIEPNARDTEPPSFQKNPKELPLSITKTNNKTRKQNSSSIPAVKLDEAFLNGYFQGLFSNAIKNGPQSLPVNTSDDVPDTMSPMCSCVWQCCFKYPDHLRQMISNKYNQFSFEDRMYFVESHITTEQNPIINSGTKLIWCYYLPSNAGRIKVCRIMFRNTFNLSHKQLRAILVRKLSDLKNQPFNIDDLSMESEYSDNSSIEIKFESHSEESNETADSSKSKEQSCNALDVPNKSIDIGGDLPTDSDYRVGSSMETKVDNLVNNKPENNCPITSTVHNPVEPGCCLRQCFLKFPAHHCETLLGQYSELARKDRMKYLRNYIKIVAPIQRRFKAAKPSRRKYSYFYYLPCSGDFVHVCKNMFINTFGITDKKLRRFIESIANDQSRAEKEMLHDLLDAAAKDDSSVDIKLEYDSDDLNEMIVGD